MTDLETLDYCIEHIDPSTLEYNEWLVVGCAIKNSGGPVEQWESWSSRDSGRYKAGECERKWKTLQGSHGQAAGIGSMVKFLRDQGGELPENLGISSGLGRAFGWDDLIPSEDMVVVKSGWVKEDELPEVSKDWNPIRDFRTYLETLFSAEDYVGYVTDAWQDDSGKWMPKKGVWTRTAGELLELCRNGSDLSKVIGDWHKECGGWIRFNPLNGKGVSDSNVTAFRYALVESDAISVDKQYSIAKELELPVAAMVHSGGKSLHLIVKIDAPDFKEYQKRVDFLYEVCKKNGMIVDRQNRNPSRLSRLPGVTRNEHKQYLVATNIGKTSYQEWMEWIAAQNDELPDFESAGNFIANPPSLADCLIEGVVRQGHKMLLSGPSKAGKSFLLLELCVAIVEGLKWLGWQCLQGRVLYINLELDRASCYHRIADVYKALKIAPQNADKIDLWHLRGKSMGMDMLAPKLIRRALKLNYVAIVLDPIYKVITGDENAADQMAKFCNQFDKVCAELGVSMIYCHHHSKGDQFQKRAQDRASGSGVFARDPDALIDMIELEIDETRREQIKNTWGCEALQKTLDKELPTWRDEIGQDDAVVLKRLYEFAVDRLGQEKVASEIAIIDKSVEYATAWRIGGILREFPSFPPLNIFFRYPTHPVDDSGLLTDARPPGEPAPRHKKDRTSKEEADAITQGETLMVVEDLKQAYSVVTLPIIAKELKCSERTARRRLKSADIAVEKGIIK